MDIVVDIRHYSQDYGKHRAITLTSKEEKQLYVPAGFAHGFCTLEDDTEVLYKCSSFYSPEHENGIIWNDETLAIDWPVSNAEAIISEKDKNLLPFQDFQSPFIRKD